MSKVPAVQTSKIEAALIENNLARLSEGERLEYYKQVCDSVGLNYLTNPFAYIVLNGKLQLYAKKDAAEQLRKIHRVSLQIVSKEIIGDAYVVHVKARDKNGTEDEATGIVTITGLKGENLANAMLKAETKAKRRATLSICGLGILDETELASIPKDAVQVTSNPQITNPLKEVKQAEVVHTPDVLDDTPLGDFICRVGKKYAGKKLSEIGEHDLDKYLEWLHKSAAEKGQDLTGDWKEFAEQAELYLKSREFGNEPMPA